MNPRHTRTALFALTAALLLSPCSSLAAQDQPAPAIELGSPFRDNAILQREMPLPVWGWSKPGTTVTVEFAGQKESATAGADGKWMLQLKPLTASADPAEMVVQEPGKKSSSKTSSSARSGWPRGNPTCSGSPANVM